MSVSFVSAFAGENAVTFAMPYCAKEHKYQASILDLLGKQAYLFRYLIGGEEINIKKVLHGNVTVCFVKQEVTFSVFFFSVITQRMWSVGELCLAPCEAMGISKPRKGTVELRAHTLWESWLQPALNDFDEESGVYKKLAQLIDIDIMKAPKVRKRNILHEMQHSLTVDLYFVLDSEGYLNLKLQAPANEFLVETTKTQESREAFERLIREIPLH